LTSAVFLGFKPRVRGLDGRLSRKLCFHDGRKVRAPLRQDAG